MLGLITIKLFKKGNFSKLRFDLEFTCVFQKTLYLHKFSERKAIFIKVIIEGSLVDDLFVENETNT